MKSELMFPENVWYVAAYPDEVSDKPLARTLLEQPLVFYRTKNGKAVALEDKCIHRMLPLSRGWVVDDQLQCGYHGALYNTNGKCTRVPGQENVPEKAQVRSYPVQERYGFVWVWMGEPELASSSDPCSLYSYLDEEGWDTKDGYIYINAGYELSNDNLADVTHTEFVHKSTLGAEAFRVGRKENKPQEQQDGQSSFRSDLREDGFDAVMHVSGAKISPAFEQAYAHMHGKENCVDLEVDVRIHFTQPGFWIFSPRINRVGANESDRVWVNGILINTPETKYTTHFFHKMSQKYVSGNKEVTKHWHEQTTFAFHEDKEVLEYQQQGIGKSDVHDHPVVSFEGDRLGFVARRIIRTQIAANQSA